MNGTVNCKQPQRLWPYNETRPNSAGNTIRPLTHSSDQSREGLGMKPTHYAPKQCEQCGKSFTKTPKETRSRWESRRFCTSRCAALVVNPGKGRKYMLAAESKVCVACGVDRPLDAFSRSKSGPLGRASRCRSCESEKLRKNRRENGDAMRAAEAKKRARRRAPRVYGCEPMPTDKCCTGCGKTLPLVQFAKGRAKYGRQQICRDCTSEYKKRYAADHPETGWRTDYRRRAKRYGVTPVIEYFTRDDVAERYGERCAYCWSGDFEQLDHYVPVANGGTHKLANVRPTCTACNRRKNSISGDEFEVPAS